MKEVYYHFRQYIDTAKWAYLESLETEDELAWMTVSTAMEYARRNPVSARHSTMDGHDVC